MQRTPNLGLPQFEPSDKYRLEDYNEAYMKIDEKVKDLDDKEAQLDTKLKEAQSIIDTWTQFKNSGGSIGGSINANNKISLIGDEISFRSENHNRGLVFNDKVSTIYDWKNNRHIFRVDETNSMSTVYANDFYFGQYSKNANGYTKLPNGLIIQWGHLHLANNLGSGVIRVTVPFPIQFPKDVLRVCLTPNVNHYHVDDEYSASWERPPVTCQITPSNFEFAFQRLQGHYGAGIDWFAIGY